MRREILLILPILATMLSVLAFGGLNSVTAKDMSGNETTMMSNITNATMGGNNDR